MLWTWLGSMCCWRCDRSSLGHLSVQISDCRASAISEPFFQSVGFIVPITRLFSGVQRLCNKLNLNSVIWDSRRYPSSIATKRLIFLTLLD